MALQCCRSDRDDGWVGGANERNHQDKEMSPVKL